MNKYKITTSVEIAAQDESWARTWAMNLLYIDYDGDDYGLTIEDVVLTETDVEIDD